MTQDIRDWMVPCTARDLIANTQARGSWSEVPWSEPGVVLNVLEELGEDYTDVVGLPLATTLQHFVRPEFVLQARCVVGEYAAKLAKVAAEVFEDYACFLHWECLEFVVRYFDDIVDWMIEQDAWNLPCAPVSSYAEISLVDTITHDDVRFWHRVLINLTYDHHREMAKDAVKCNPAALLHMRFAAPKGYITTIVERDGNEDSWWESDENAAIEYSDDWNELYKIVEAADSELAVRVPRPSWLLN